MISADTNVFIYVSDDTAPEKQRTAALVTDRLLDLNVAVALQVVGEFRHVLQRKFKRPAARASQLALDLVRAYTTFAYGHTSVERALEYSAAGLLSYWDALLLSAADEAGCLVMLSEDMADGLRFGGLRVVNPFAQDGSLSLAAREVLA